MSARPYLTDGDPFPTGTLYVNDYPYPAQNDDSYPGQYPHAELDPYRGSYAANQGRPRPHEAAPPRSRTRKGAGRPRGGPSGSPSAHGSRTPLLLRSTLIAGLIAAAGVSLMRAQDVPSPDSNLSLGSRTATVADASGESQVQSCRVRHAITARSPGRFTAVVTITNTGRSAVRGWTLRWTYPGLTQQTRPRLTDGWNAAVIGVGAGGQAMDMDDDRVLPVGGTMTIGYVGLVSGAVPAPSGFTLNGVTCR